MEILHNLTYIVGDLSRRSEEILKEGVELLKNYDPIVGQVLSIQTHLRKDQVSTAVREEIIALLCDSQHTQNEIKSFAEHLAKGERVNTTKCPFLSKVWHGDMYGITGIEGLHALMEDLNKQYNLLVGNGIIEKLSESTKK
jgi:hypothetical protein